MKPSERIKEIMFPDGLTAFGGQMPVKNYSEAIIQYLDEQAEKSK